MEAIIEIIKFDFPLEVFRISPKYCASLPQEYIDSNMAFIPTLRKMGYLARNLKIEDIFFTRAIERVRPEDHHYNS